MLIRTEEKQDHAAVHTLNIAVFESSAEAGLVDALREKADPIVSLVAQIDDEIEYRLPSKRIGHHQISCCIW